MPKYTKKKIQKMPAGPKKETFPKPAGQGHRKLPQRLGFHVCNLTTFGEGNTHHQRSTGRSSGFHHDHRVTPLTKLDAKSQISCRRITTWKSQWKRKTQKRWSIYNASNVLSCSIEHLYVLYMYVKSFEPYKSLSAFTFRCHSKVYLR